MGVNHKNTDKHSSFKIVMHLGRSYVSAVIGSPHHHSQNEASSISPKDIPAVRMCSLHGSTEGHILSILLEIFVTAWPQVAVPVVASTLLVALNPRLVVAA